MRCAYDLKPSMQTSSTYIIVFYVWCLFPRRQRFVVLSLLLLVDTNKARRVTTARRPFLREIFPPTERSSFCLGFCAYKKTTLLRRLMVLLCLLRGKPIIFDGENREKRVVVFFVVICRVLMERRSILLTLSLNWRSTCWKRK